MSVWNNFQFLQYVRLVPLLQFTVAYSGVQVFSPQATGSVPLKNIQKLSTWTNSLQCYIALAEMDGRSPVTNFKTRFHRFATKRNCQTGCKKPFWHKVVIDKEGGCSSQSCNVVFSSKVLESPALITNTCNDTMIYCCFYSLVGSYYEEWKYCWGRRLLPKTSQQQ